jgi:hypothetical protein
MITKSLKAEGKEEEISGYKLVSALPNLCPLK